MRIENVDTIIWDEASMSSKHMLEFLNVLHHRISEDHTKKNSFGGKQMILVGELFQLRLVPNCGKFYVSSSYISRRHYTFI